MDPAGLTNRAPGPIRETDRNPALDVLRGFAVFGIFMVNMQFFAMPLADLVVEPVPSAAGGLDLAFWAIVKGLFEYKFVGLFSLLFGAGMAVQMRRADAAGRAFGPVYLRRLGVLAVIGLCHALFLWYGDILFIYACIGLLVFFVRGLSPRAQMIAAAVLLAVSIGIVGCFATLGAVVGGEGRFGPAFEKPEVEGTPPVGGVPERPADPGPAPVETDPWERFAATVRSVDWEDPSSVRRIEVAAYRDGPFLAALLVRGASFVVLLLVVTFGGFVFRVAGLFLLGAALMKLGFFDAARRRLHGALGAACLAAGLAGEGLGVWSFLRLGQGAGGWALAVGEWSHEIGSLLLCLGYAGAMAYLAHGPMGRALTRPLAAVGRLALTNYLLQTLVATWIMYWWGLGLFGGVGRAAQSGLVVAIFAGQVLLSMAWLSVLRVGPAEWFWRTFTYGRLQPILRRST